LKSRRAFILELIEEGRSFEEIIRITKEQYPQENYRQKHESALSSILWETGRSIHRERKNPTSLKPSRTKVIKHEANEVIHDLAEVESLRREMEKRREILVEQAHNSLIDLDPTDKENIIKFLDKGLLPERPTDEIHLMKEFISSCLSINQPPHRIRSRMTAILGKIPLADTIPLCLHKLFDCSDFLLDPNWKPSSLETLIKSLKDEDEKFSDQFRRDVLDTLDSVASKMSFELEAGINQFYDRITREIRNGPESVWEFLKRFTKNLRGVGPSLMSDFLKNIGFGEFVKIDQRLKKELPNLIKDLKLTPKEMFIFSWYLCERLQMTPFIFDQILYQWGNPRLKPYLVRS